MTYNPALNNIRGIAALLVMMSHYFYSVVFPLHFLGAAGVDIFFYLSGFLITCLLVDKGLLRAPENRGRCKKIMFFYWRRMLRIFPLYYLVLLLIFLLVKSDEQTLFRNYFVYFLGYVPNWAMYKAQFWPYMTSHFWSLGVEEQYYLVWPWLLLLTSRKNLPGMLWIVAVLSASVKVWMSLTGYNEFLHILLVNCVYKFSLGALLFVYRNLLASMIDKGGRALAAGTIAVLVFIFSCYYFNPLIWILQDLSIFVIAALMINNAYAQKPVFVLRSTLLMQAGLISYGIYVFHLPVYQGLKWVLQQEIMPWWGILFAMATTILAARCSFLYFESYFLQWKDRMKWV